MRPRLSSFSELQVGLCDLQEWVKAKGLRVIIVFEGRDTAGKGGTIKAITERVLTWIRTLRELEVVKVATAWPIAGLACRRLCSVR